MSERMEPDAAAIPNCRRRQFERFAAISGVAGDPVALERLVTVLSVILPRRTAHPVQAGHSCGGKPGARSTYARQTASRSLRSIAIPASPDAR